MDPKTVSLASRIAALYLAAQDPTSASLAALFKSEFDAAGSGVDWEYDTQSGLASKGARGKRFSLSGKPSSFYDGMLRIGLLVVGGYEPHALTGGGNGFLISLRVNTYLKVPGLNGEGKYDDDTAVRLGDFLVDNSFKIIHGSIPVAVSRLKAFYTDVADHPPDFALSQSKPAIQKRDQDRAYLEMSKQGERESELRKEDKENYSDLKWVISQLGEEFGPADVRFVLQKRGQSPDAGSYKSLRAELEAAGLKFSPGLTLQLASEPWAVAEELRVLADGIDLSDGPSRSTVASELRRILASF